MSGHIVSKKTYFTVFGILMVLLALTVAAAHTHLGEWNIYVALTIAAVKAIFVVVYFMHLKYSYKLIWVVVAGGLFWFALLLVGTYADYISRAWIPVVGAFQ